MLRCYSPGLTPNIAFLLLVPISYQLPFNRRCVVIIYPGIIVMFCARSRPRLSCVISYRRSPLRITYVLFCRHRGSRVVVKTTIYISTIYCNALRANCVFFFFFYWCASLIVLSITHYSPSSVWRWWYRLRQRFRCFFVIGANVIRLPRLR